MRRSRRLDQYPVEWMKISALVKDRVKWSCESCGTDHGSVPAVLTVHHLNRDKRNPNHLDDYLKTITHHGHHPNLIALCQRCHLRAEHWAIAGEFLTRQECLDRLQSIRDEETRQGTLWDT